VQATVADNWAFDTAPSTVPTCDETAYAAAYGTPAAGAATITARYTASKP